MEDKFKPHSTPFPAIIKRADIRAIQQVMNYAGGRELDAPPPEVMRKALDWIMFEACKYYDVCHFSDNEGGKNEAFMNGRRYVGKQITLIERLKPESFPE